MTPDGIFVRTGITTKDIHQDSRLPQGFSTIVPLHDGDHVGGPLATVL
jgi:hypothetical protein